MGTWKFDPLHLQVEFAAKHLGMMTVRGHFAEVTGTGDIFPDRPERSRSLELHPACEAEPRCCSTSDPDVCCRRRHSRSGRAPLRPKAPIPLYSWRSYLRLCPTEAE